MSEENDEKWRSYALDNRNKITELEKKVNTQAEKIKGFQFTVNRFLKKNLERIEKLERDNVTTIEIVKENDNIFNKELSELKVRSAAHTEVLQVMVEDYYEGTFKECMLESLGSEKTVVSQQNTSGNSVKGTNPATDSKPPSCERYHPDYCDNPCEYLDDVNKCDLIKLSNQMRGIKKPLRCCIPKCVKKVVFVHKNGWNFCEEHKPKENPSEQDIAGSARQTELYCHCCGTVILEEKDRFCSSCFNDVQKMQKEKEPTDAPIIKAMAGFKWVHDGVRYVTTEMEDLEWLLSNSFEGHPDRFMELRKKYLEEDKE